MHRKGRTIFSFVRTIHASTNLEKSYRPSQTGFGEIFREKIPREKFSCPLGLRPDASLSFVVPLQRSSRCCFFLGASSSQRRPPVKGMRLSSTMMLHWSRCLRLSNNSCAIRTLFTGRQSGVSTTDSATNKLDESVESADDFTHRIFGGLGDSSSGTDPFYQKLDRLEKARGRTGFGSRRNNGDSSGFQNLDDMEAFDTLSDGMDGKLKKAAMSYPYNDEIKNDDYAFRPDVSFRQGMTYTIKDIDLTKPGVNKRAPREEFETTTEEVLRKADFRNVRFLSNFITEAGIIIKRSKTGISAKAQRRVAREIKTARAFGLMPFTTMGTKPFVFGKSVEDLDEDYNFEYFGGNFVAGFGSKGEAAT